MRNISTALLVSSLFFVSPVMVHAHGSGGHSHVPASKSEVIKKATEKVKSLVESGKLDKSWKGVKAVDALLIGDTWKVTYKNDKVSDTTKQTLYVFMSLNGAYYAANFTGQ